MGKNHEGPGGSPSDSRLRQPVAGDLHGTGSRTIYTDWVRSGVGFDERMPVPHRF